MRAREASGSLALFAFAFGALVASQALVLVGALVAAGLAAWEVLSE